MAIARGSLDVVDSPPGTGQECDELEQVEWFRWALNGPDAFYGGTSRLHANADQHAVTPARSCYDRRR